MVKGPVNKTNLKHVDDHKLCEKQSNCKWNFVEKYFPNLV